MSDIHYRCNDYYGRDMEEIAETLTSDLKSEYQKAPYDALLLLGDYSLDHWAWEGGGSFLNQGISNAKIFAEKYLPRLAPSGVEVRMIAGNHEQFGEENWQRLTGHSRNSHIVVDNILFILTDTFGGDLDPTVHSDGTYTGARVDDIKALMERYPDKKVILCAHWFDIEGESDEFRALLRTEERIKCLFCGHSHKSIVENTGEEAGNKPILYTGNYSYSDANDSVLYLPGYRRLTIDSDGISCCYVVPSHKYKIKGVFFTNDYTEQDKWSLKF